MWLKVMPNEGDVRMLWGNESGPTDPYHIGAETLRATCERVRDALAAMVRLSGDPERIPAALRTVAQRGSELFWVLFNPIRKEDRGAAEAVKGWVAEQVAGGDRRLRITGHSKLHVPWALVHEGDAPATESPAVCENFPGFWGLKYDLAAVLSGYGQPVAKLRRKTGRMMLLSLMNREVAEQAYERFDDATIAAYDRLMALPVGVARDHDAFEQLVDQAASHDTILNFFGHQKDGMLDLGDGSAIGIVQFEILLERLAEQRGAPGEPPPYGLVMLNACESAAGTFDYSFAAAADRPGMCGVIGTEAVVPRDFAAQFAIRFLTLLTDGVSVGEAITELRHCPLLWPLSLVYGCYAHPDYRIGAAAH